MKVKVSFDWDKLAQKEVGVEIDIPKRKAQELIRSFFMKLDYKQRQTWIHKNVPDKNVKHISEEELYE
jgi:hypothetical protein